MIEERRDARRRRDRSRDRIVPQRSLAGLQDGRRHRARALGPVSSARGRARRDGRRRRGRWSSSRPTTRSRPPRTSRRDATRREDLHLDARQGSRAVRARRPCRAGRPPKRRRFATRRACAKNSASSRVDSRLSRARRRFRRTAIPGFRASAPSAAARLINKHGAHREFPAGGARARRELALLFKTLATLRTDAPLFSDVRRAPMAWSDAAVRGVRRPIGRPPRRRPRGRGRRALGRFTLERRLPSANDYLITNVTVAGSLVVPPPAPCR